MMSKKVTYTLYALLASFLLIVAIILLPGGDFVVLQPKGWIAHRERSLIVIASLLMLIVVIPVFILTFYTAWKYREGNPKATYDPNWDQNHLAEAIWWGLPLIIVILLSILAYKSSYELNPFQPIASDKKPVKIQVIALPWKWLFLYPEEGVASVNFLQIPLDTPIAFEISADAPMNSFWIPQLGGQIYAMPGMTSKLHLIANEKGDYRGCSAQLSGDGFAGMTFTARAGTDTDFSSWLRQIQTSPPLDQAAYGDLLAPSQYHPVVFYSLPREDLFETILMKYMMPGENPQ